MLESTSISVLYSQAAALLTCIKFSIMVNNFLNTESISPSIPAMYENQNLYFLKKKNTTCQL
jgi:hypothetical protein